MTELDPFFQKWFSCVVRVTLVGFLAISGCTSKDSGDHSNGQSKPIPQQSNSRPSAPVHKQVGEASWYGPGFHGQETANGETYNQKDLTAAHPSLPMGTTAKVTNLENGKKVEVRINDRGPFIQDRVIDLSSAAANKLDMKKEGAAQVKIETRSAHKKHSAKKNRKKKVTSAH
jgi:rare lipoprotein A